ncbi:AraC family transcriptional regulator [Empedobacter sp. GD03797]|uniref:helix-turn-helix domain-containing protein n=1 Tax=Empedobacter sp. GD03797 TaxID=2975382 RepID=UPI00244749CF|nr:AraC family transcriptional regulator [Empedobacter sp. GD03797]MDH1883442.1 AraC family transcriptional regulator [Empedobacter sp. GD03797]
MKQIIGEYSDHMKTNTYVWYEKNRKNADEVHSHDYFQLNYVEEGYQYFHIEQKIYLVPQNHVIWIPANKLHRTTSEAKTVNPMLILFKEVFKDDFYNDIHVFVAPPILKEMMLYASKWNKFLVEEKEQKIFLNSMLYSLPHFCDENHNLELPVLVDKRLIPMSEYIHSYYKTNFNLNELADKANMSARNLQRIFKQETGITLQKYMQLVRILKSIELIDTNNFTLSEIAYKVGYKSLPAFTASYFAVTKTKPKRK